LRHGGVGVDYDPAWCRRYPVRLGRAILLDNLTRPLAQILASPEVRGDEMLGLVDPPVIFAANHASHIDTPLLLSVLPVRFRHKTAVAAAADYFFDRRWKAHLWAFALAAFPIERQRVNRRSADVAAELVEDGWNLVIFPEGGRSPDGWQQEFRGGAAYLAARTGRPVVPVHMSETWRILRKDGKLLGPSGKGLRRSPVTITFGNAIVPGPGEDSRLLASRIERAVSVLADESRSDWWAARVHDAAGTTPPARGPDASAWRRSWLLGPAPPSRGKGLDGATSWVIRAKLRRSRKAPR
jgi:1-acyl-sn-glycerol-3-phosphate acyltransferase